MEQLIEQLRQRFPDLSFTAGRQFCWSPETREIFYKEGSLHDSEHTHEDAHTRVQFGSNVSTGAERTQKVREHRSGAVEPKCAECERRAIWSLLHETGHALLGHRNYEADFELLRMEIAAWERARELAASFDLTINDEHIQDCLDTYRDWLYKRSICPQCSAKCLQQADFNHYRCFNCHTVWSVSANRFGRAYRRTNNVPQATVFHLATEL